MCRNRGTCLQLTDELGQLKEQFRETDGAELTRRDDEDSKASPLAASPGSSTERPGRSLRLLIEYSR